MSGDMRALTLFFFTVLAPLAAQAPEPVRPWLFFDLGDTLIGTETDPETGDLARLWWTRFRAADGSVTDAHAYLTRMKALGFRIGLIVNIPQYWGDAGLRRARAWRSEPDEARRRRLMNELTKIKLDTIAEYFRGRGPGDAPDQLPRWNDPAFPSLDWSLFDPEGRLVPFFDENRKPDKAPYTSTAQLLLFQQALEIARRSGLPAVYQGENPHEIAAAKDVGLIGHQVPYVDGVPVQAKGFFLGEAEILEALTRR